MKLEKAVAGIALMLMISAGTFLLLTGCQNNSRDDVTVSIGQSEKFSSDEINDAVDCVIAKFDADFSGCTLTDLWYDESHSDLEIQSYIENGRGAINGVAEENVIALLSNFDVDESGGDGSLNPNFTYTDWNWILIRDSKDGGWTVDDWGY